MTLSKGGLVERIATMVCGRALRSRGGRRRAWQALRTLLIALFDDPPRRAWVHGRTLWLPASHALPGYLQRHPLYDALPGRVANFVRGRHGLLSCVDVGANVGDTIAAFHPQSQDRFMAVEGSERYLRYLRRNFSEPQVQCVRAILAEVSGFASVELREDVGTAALVESISSRAPARVSTLDDLLEEIAAFAPVNLLKVDTDGSDLSILRGAERLVERDRPTVIFECEASRSEQHVNDLLAVLDRFAAAGYGGLIAYDNLGYFAGAHPLADLGAFLEQVFRSLIGAVDYLDVVVTDESGFREFADSEERFFIERLSGLEQRKAAERGAEVRRVRTPGRYG